MISRPRGRGFRTRTRLLERRAVPCVRQIETEPVDAGGHRDTKRDLGHLRLMP